MRVNVYAEEMTARIQIICKVIDGQVFTGVRFYLGFPFVHRKGDDDSSAVTFWGKKDLRCQLKKALKLLDRHYSKKPRPGTCRFCGCQEFTPCLSLPGAIPCGWADKKRTICTRCAVAKRS